MSDQDRGDTYTAFVGTRCLARGALADVSAAVQSEADAGAAHIVILSDQTGRTVDPTAPPAPSAMEKPTRGRPKLGVTAREVTLLPRHWDWLGAQPGGASAALRRLVDAARRDSRSNAFLDRDADSLGKADPAPLSEALMLAAESDRLVRGARPTGH